MNSMEEKELFESWGWEQDLVQRLWRAPVGGAVIMIDSLVEYMETPEREEELKRLVASYGKRS